MERRKVRKNNTNIREYIKAVLPAMGLKEGVDFRVSRGYLWLRHIKQKVGQVSIMLKEAFPMFNFYWNTPRTLVWF